MTARELIDGADICAVWTGLGGGPVRRGKACAWWRGSESYSVSISTEKSAFYDFGPGEGGGILRLVETVLGCDRRTALQWLASFYHADLDDRPLSIDQRRAWQCKRTEAERKATQLVQWWEDLLFELRYRRDAIWERVAAAERFGRAFVNEVGRDDLWDFAFECLAEESEGERLEAWIIRIEAMLPGELVALRRRMNAREAVAA